MVGHPCYPLTAFFERPTQYAFRAAQRDSHLSLCDTPTVFPSVALVEYIVRAHPAPCADAPHGSYSIVEAFRALMLLTEHLALRKCGKEIAGHGQWAQSEPSKRI